MGVKCHFRKIKFQTSVIFVILALNCSKPEVAKLETKRLIEKSARINRHSEGKIFSSFALVLTPSFRITQIDGMKSRILLKGDLLHVKHISQMDIEVELPDFDARIPLQNVRLLSPSNVYEPNAIEMSAIQAAAFIYDLEMQIGRKYLGKPTDKLLCIKHFEQGYLTEAAKKFADNFCKPYGEIMTGSDDFFNGPVLHIKPIKTYGAETIDLCIATWESTGSETAITTLKKQGTIWKIVKGEVSKC